MELIFYSLFNYFVSLSPPIRNVTITGADEDFVEEIKSALLSLDEHPMPMEIKVANLGDKTLGLTRMDSMPCLVTISPRARETFRTKTVVWHEYGHCVGFEHSNDQDDIMYRSVWEFFNYKKKYIDSFVNRVRRARQ